MRHEIFADVLYSMNIETYLFAILVNHISEDEVEITLDDFDKVRYKFINCGIREVNYNFTMQELREWMNSHPDYIRAVGEDRWVANMKEFIGDIDAMSIQEKKFVYNNDELAKVYCLFCNLGMDLRIFDDYGCVASLLHCNFMVNDSGQPRRLTPSEREGN